MFTTTRSLTPWTNYNASDDYIDTITEYEPNDQIETQHDLSRFGRTNDIAALYEKGEEEQRREQKMMIMKDRIILAHSSS